MLGQVERLPNQKKCILINTKAKKNENFKIELNKIKIGNKINIKQTIY